MSTLTETAPSFVEMAHRIVWAIGATVDTHGRPTTRVLSLSLTYWTANQDTCTAAVAIPGIMSHRPV